MLSARGFQEAMSLLLDQSARYEKIAPIVYIHNTSNVHLDSLRADLMPNMLSNILRNRNRQNHDVRLFEFGKTYSRDGASFIETNRLILAMTGRREAESWLNSGGSSQICIPSKPRLNPFFNFCAFRDGRSADQKDRVWSRVSLG